MVFGERRCLVGWEAQDVTVDTLPLCLELNFTHGCPMEGMGVGSAQVILTHLLLGTKAWQP